MSLYHKYPYRAVVSGVREVNAEVIKTAFSRYGKVLDVYHAKNTQTGELYGHVYVTFETEKGWWSALSDQAEKGYLNTLDIIEFNKTLA